MPPAVARKKKAKVRVEDVTEETVDPEAEADHGEEGGSDEEQLRSDMQEPDRDTVASNCRVYGGGIQEATVRQHAFFWIKAHDVRGRKRLNGGDSFFVAIRGPAVVRARVLDNDDGTYLVVWKPTTSGAYTITISHFGVTLPGVPVVVTASTSLPCAARCSASGDALFSAVSRTSQSFEIMFRDRLNQTAHAVELDVFAEPVPPNSPRGMRPPEDPVRIAKEAAEAARVQKKADEAERERETAMSNARGRRSPSPPSSGGRRGSSFVGVDMQGAAAAQIAAAAHAAAQKKASGSAAQAAAVAAAQAAAAQALEQQQQQLGANEDAPLSAPSAAGSFKKQPFAVEGGAERLASDDADSGAARQVEAGARYRAMRVRVEKPLTVRRQCSLKGQPLGKLQPGTVVTVIEERFQESSDGVESMVFGCIALDSIGLFIDQTGQTNANQGAPPLWEPFNIKPTEGGARAGVKEGVPFTAQTVAPSVEATAAEVSQQQAQQQSPPAPSPAASTMPAETPATETAAPSASAPFAVHELGRPHPQTGRRGQVGWVLLRKGGVRLVTSRVKLGPDSRRQYSRQWERRRATDKMLERKARSASGASEKGIQVRERETEAQLRLELTSDPAGIGFAFGGVEPGTLHAHGQLHERHKVYFSIGLAGDYFLHVRLRQQAKAIPGSPFRLTVLPGPAHARSTRLSPEKLLGRVGTEAGVDVGCHQSIHTADKMGNFCISGEAKVTIIAWRGEAERPAQADLDVVETSVQDRGDGSYRLEWKSISSGTFTTRVLLNDEDVEGSPRTFTLTSSTPEITKTVLEGDGLSKAIAGTPATIVIRFVDQFSNTALPGPDFRFGMAFLKDKERVQNAEAHEFEGRWEDGDTGVYVMSYEATKAGACKLHVWCEPSSKDERVAFPGSPFSLTVHPGAASTDVSQVTGWSKLQKEEKNAKYGKAAAADPSALVAGDTLMIRPEIFDPYGNQTVLAEGALDVTHELPDGSRAALRYTQQQLRGSDLLQYDIRHDTSVSGDHNIHLTINSAPIKGSPVTFRVSPDKPDPQSCKLSGPLNVLPDEPLFVDRQYTVLLRTFDKFGNACWVGGHKFGVRLQLVKQSAHDQTALVPQNHSLETEDLQDGTYNILLTVNFACAVKLFANLDKNLPAMAGELPPVNLSFIKGEGGGKSVSIAATNVPAPAPAFAPSPAPTAPAPASAMQDAEATRVEAPTAEAPSGAPGPGTPPGSGRKERKGGTPPNSGRGANKGATATKIKKPTARPAPSAAKSPQSSVTKDTLGMYT